MLFDRIWHNHVSNIVLLQQRAFHNNTFLSYNWKNFKRNLLLKQIYKQTKKEIYTNICTHITTGNPWSSRTYLPLRSKKQTVCTLAYSGREKENTESTHTTALQTKFQSWPGQTGLINTSQGMKWRCRQEKKKKRMDKPITG